MSEQPRAARGAGWVAVQLALMVAALAAGLAPPAWPDAADRPLDIAGAVSALAGAALVVLSARALGRSLTPFPRPKRGGGLVTTGPYRRVRHPIYTGGILFFAGYALATTAAALTLAAALAVFWAFKARVEERLLAVAYPDYGAYARRTRWALIPRVY